MDNCPGGCTECNSPFCTCASPEQNPDYAACQSKIEELYHSCLFDCGVHDYECFAGCNREYDESLQFCPCMADCPVGCPCPTYDCNEVTTSAPITSAPPLETNHVLVLNT